MKQINIIIFYIFFYLVNSQVPSGSVVNTCGKIGYNEPSDQNDCKENGEICCFVHLKKIPTPGTPGTLGEKKFCVSAPSKISIEDVKEDIESYTNFELHQLVCNNSNFIKITIIISLLFLFVLI